LIRMSIVGLGFLYLAYVILGERMATFAVPLAAWHGTLLGVFWSAYNLNQYIHSDSKRRIQYFSSLTTVLNLLRSVAPAIGGGIIVFVGVTLGFGTNGGYGMLFLIVAAILTALGVFVGKLPDHERLTFTYRSFLAHRHTTEWKFVLAAQFLSGLYDNSVGIVIGILFYIVLKQEGMVGLVQSAMYLLIALGSIASTKLLFRSPNWYWLGAVGLSFGLLVFSFSPNMVGIVAIIVCAGFLYPFLSNWLSTSLFHALDHDARNWQEKYHLLIERDMVLGIGRIVSFALILPVKSAVDQEMTSRTWMLGLSVVPLILGVLLTAQQSAYKK